ncbi:MULTISPECIES: DUF3180 domain-containing protein [unclassified Arthrobacter]|jgi:hypothetical protein|uniref:DUF3180 domain-containing protein n=1 Tax=unclassified Arthrobacter TaxID=235627 RepID=UPI0009A85AFB|nr:MULTISPECIES: DUF3180 domain-containing protein [unclassified Arthrobacter]RDV10266.1 DUF3180 domain-containing protein [Arthrobacter sp. RT-1]SLK03032.1 Protein of unknown function [Arthrobacter sp. P2b]
MKPINPLRLMLIGIILAVAGWAATVVTSRYSMATPVLPATALATMGVIVAITLILGIRVLRWRNSITNANAKKKTVLDPLLAARTLVLAQACAYAGTVLLGWHVGIFLDQLRIWSLRSDQGITWLALAMAGGGLVMIVVGLLVERFCKIPPEDGDTKGVDGKPGRQVRGEAAGEGEYAYRGD